MPTSFQPSSTRRKNTVTGREAAPPGALSAATSIFMNAPSPDGNPSGARSWPADASDVPMAVDWPVALS